MYIDIKKIGEKVGYNCLIKLQLDIKREAPSTLPNTINTFASLQSLQK